MDIQLSTTDRLIQHNYGRKIVKMRLSITPMRLTQMCPRQSEIEIGHYKMIRHHKKTQRVLLWVLTAFREMSLALMRSRIKASTMSSTLNIKHSTVAFEALPFIKRCLGRNDGSLQREQIAAYHLFFWHIPKPDNENAYYHAPFLPRALHERYRHWRRTFFL